MTKGGMILTNDESAASWFKIARAKGRHPHEDVLYKNETFEQIGWNMYMPPEHAAQGILIFDEMKKINEDSGSDETYHDLTRHPIFSQDRNQERAF